MHCPFCSHKDTQVKDSRPAEDGRTIRRRRCCPACNGRFTTCERLQLREMLVVKKDGSVHVFDRDKLTRSLVIALRKRPFDSDTISGLVDRVVHHLEVTGEMHIPSTLIGEAVMTELRTLDTVAYIRFASVYKAFRNSDDFTAFLAELQHVTLRTAAREVS